MIDNGIFSPMAIEDNIEGITKSIVMTTEDKNIIYTFGLATCIGLLFYCKNLKKAFSLHVSSSISGNMEKDIYLITTSISEFINKNNLNEEEIEYIIIPGYYHTEKMENILKELNNYFDSKPLFSKLEHNDYSSLADLEYKSAEFAFDAKDKKFVTSTYFKGDPYYLIDRKINYEISYHEGKLKLPDDYIYDENIPGTYFHDCIRFRKKELDLSNVNSSKKEYRALKETIFGSSYPFSITDNYINYKPKNSVFNKYYDFDDGYYISKTDDYFDIVEKDKLKEYLDYRYIGDCFDELQDKKKVKVSSRVFKNPIFKSIQLNEENKNNKKIV